MNRTTPYPEELLPHELRLETAIAEYRDEIDAAADETLRTDNDIIPLEVRFSKLASSLYGYSSQIARIMEYSTEDSVKVQEATFRGVCFGLLVANVVKYSPVGEFPTHTITEELQEQRGDVFLLSSVQRYLARRPLTDDVISYYMPEIDPTHLSYHHAEVGAGLCLMLTERTHGAAYSSFVSAKSDINQ